MEEGGEISASLKIKLCKCRRTNEGMEIENGNETGNHDENFSINKYKIQEKKNATIQTSRGDIQQIQTPKHSLPIT